MIDKMDSVNPHAYAYAFLFKTCSLIEEPNFTVDNLENFKLIMGGEAMILNPKNCDPFVHVPSGFCVMTANGIPWKRYERKPFENRCYMYNITTEAKFTTFISSDIFWTIFKQWSLQPNVQETLRA